MPVRSDFIQVLTGGWPFFLSPLGNGGTACGGPVERLQPAKQSLNSFDFNHHHRSMNALTVAILVPSKKSLGVFDSRRKLLH